MKLLTRDVPPRVAFALEQAGVHPLLARLLAARGVRNALELSDDLAHLLKPSSLLGAQAAGNLLADAIQAGQHICIVADYDCDGATACAVGLRGLKLLGAKAEVLSYVVPDRVKHGYGLTPPIVDEAVAQCRARHGQAPEVLVTVDNGIASQAGVAHAKALGLAVLITDHHLPAADVPLPVADVIVNPNQPACTFESKAMAGVGVMFYVLLAARAQLRQRGAFEAASAQPRLDSLLDLVALGTVADVVKLDANNRRLVAQGLKRIRAGRMQPGVAALFSVAGRDAHRASCFDFGFALGPRINAAGRLADMTLGIECLTTEDPGRALDLARQLDAINRERRSVETGMREEAERHLAALIADAKNPPAALALFHEDFHEGVVGIVAGRVKDQLHRPTFVFARGANGQLKGSGRSIPGFHLRDALDLVAKRHPNLLARFGGHAMAAGCTLAPGGKQAAGESEEERQAQAHAQIQTFAKALELVASQWLEPEDLTRTVRSDGPLGAEYFNHETATLLAQQVWGQGFEAPQFSEKVQVLQQRLLQGKHLKLKIRAGGAEREGIWFNREEPLPDEALLVYQVQADEWNGARRVQVVVQGCG